MRTKTKRILEVGRFKFGVTGGRFSVAQLKECLYAYTDYLEFCKKEMLFPVPPVTFLFSIAGGQRKSESGKRKLIRQLTEKMGLFPFLFWTELRSYAWKTANIQIDAAFKEAKETEKKKKKWSPLSWIRMGIIR